MTIARTRIPVLLGTGLLAVALASASAGGVGASLAAGTPPAGPPSSSHPAAASATGSGTPSHRVSTPNVPGRAEAAKRTVIISFAPRKPLSVSLQRLSGKRYVTVKSASRPGGTSVKLAYTPPRGTTHLRAVAVWPRHVTAASPPRTTVWVGKPVPAKPGLNANGDPTANIPEPSSLDACWSSGASDPACLTAEVAAINLGRTREHLAAFVLPSNWSSLSPAEQMLAISNNERSVRGLRPISGLSTTLNGYARTAAAANADPTLPGWTVDGRSAYGWASNWAISPGGPLYADFLWMYDDGLGAGNIDCTPGHTSGCWGHRHNVLAWGAADSSTDLLLGAAQVTTTWSGWTGLSDATLLVEVAS